MANFFSPYSVTWRVNREAVLLLGGGRALLMQIAHPLVAAAVAKHSQFKEDPLGRLRRTMQAMRTITFGSADDARLAYRRVDSVHAGVHGTVAESAAGFAVGTTYEARNPELLFWVHATLVDTATLIYRRYVADFSAEEEEQYYQESKAIARLFNIPESLIPPALKDLRAYMHETIERGPARVSDTARELAQDILRPPVPLVPTVVFETLNLVTIGLLPPTLRAEFGLRWGSARQVLLDASSGVIRMMLPLLPDLLRAVPAARAAERLLAHGGRSFHTD